MATPTGEPELLTRVEFPLYSVSVLRYKVVAILHKKSCPYHQYTMVEGEQRGVIIC